jgi:ribosomal protein L37AE/L43A
MAGDPRALAYEFCPRCGSGPRQKADVVECPDCGYEWAGPRLLDLIEDDEAK